jgi:omega-6 fatty acid desaturase (delta-12 desaturase)
MQQPQIAQLKKEVAPFEIPNVKSAIIQLINTLGPLIALWYTSYLLTSVSIWLSLPVSVVAAFFVVRTFILFHDCCHQSFLPNRVLNDIIGNITGVITMIPYQQWKNEHAIHHSTSSNLDKRGVGDIWIMTVDEYKSATTWNKLAYRIYRHPIMMFGFGPIIVFLFLYRFNRKTARRAERINSYLMNTYMLLFYSTLVWLVGWQTFLIVQVPIFMVSGMLGIWLFYVQHQFEDTYFEREDEWSFVRAAVDGSSYYRLPAFLQWLTGNIGFHHVHHLSPKVPNYNLEQTHEQVVTLQKATTISIRTSLQAVRFRLWDEQNRTMIHFRDLKAQEQQAPIPNV